MIKVIETEVRTLISITDIERIDKSNAKEFGELFKSHIKKNAEIIINLNRVFFIDTSGFNMLLSTKKELKKVDGRLSLINLSGALSDLFNLMGLKDKFEWTSAECLTDPAFAE